MLHKDTAASEQTTEQSRLSAPVRVRVSGDFACFTRPEHKVERLSYECMTPSAARNILDAICWRPQMRWIVQRILVLKPVRFASLRRMELQSRIRPREVHQWIASPSSFRPQTCGTGSEEGTLRNTIALRDVSYVIEAVPHVYEPSPDDSALKYVAMFQRRVEKGQCFQRPFLGCREFAADFTVPQLGEEPIAESRPLGQMLYDVVFRKGGNRAIFFAANLEHGVLLTNPQQAIPDQLLRREMLECSYRR